MKKHLLLPTILLAGCGIYKTQFDCPPGEGIGCKPVGEVLEMIVESEDGEDFFIKDRASKTTALQAPKKKIKKPGPKALTLTQDETGELKLE